MSRRRQSNDDQLPPCMYRRRDTYWLVKRGKWTRLGTDKRSALVAYARLTAPSTGAMDALIRDALPWITRDKRPATVKQYRTAARILAGLLADFEPAQVQQADIFDVRRELAGTPNMANRVLSVARLIFNYAAEHRIVPVNPCIGVKPLAERKRDRYITDAELAAIRAKAGDRLKVIIDLLYLTGQRVGDVLAIRRADLTDEGIQFQQGKTGIRRTVAWNDDLRAAVEAAKALTGTVVPLTLLKGRWGGPVDYKSVQEQWTRACRLAGVTDAHIHDVRAKSATDAKRAGLDPTALLGHATPAMTARYLRLRESPVVQGPNWTSNSRRAK
jgi:integrase